MTRPSGDIERDMILGYIEVHTLQIDKWRFNDELVNVLWWCSPQTKEYCYSSVKSRPQFHGVPQEMITMEGEHQETCKISEALAY